MARARDGVGLDIGTSGVRAAHVAFGKSPMTLEGFGQVSLPQGAVHDGEIVDSAVVAQAISQLWKRAGFKRKKVSVGVANQKVVARTIEMPYMEEEELRSALQFQAQEYVPIPLEDAVLDFQPLDDYVTDNNDRMVRVMLVAAQKEMVNVVVETVKRAGLDPEAVDLTPLCLVRALGERAGVLGGAAGMGEAIIDVGAGVIQIAVHEGGVPRFVRILLVGGDSLTTALAGGLGVSFEDAENIKQKTGLAAAPGTMAGSEAAPRILDERGTAFVEEIRSSLDYYQAQPDATRISRVILVGGSSKLPNLATRLAGALRIPVEPARILDRIKPGKGLGLSESQLAEAEPLMGAAIGLALGGAEQ
jgi:type IV pilus assembly protein PilM